jgi:hypothetical protein
MWSSKARLGKRKGQFQYSQGIAFWKHKEFVQFVQSVADLFLFLH